MLAVLLGLQILAAASAANAPAVRWKPVADMDSQLYPSLIIATCRPGADDEPKPDLLGDHYGLLGVSIRSPGALPSR